ncbi:MAG: hypothetical protein C4308_12545 [Chitinophagaceae bacterium]
MKHQTLFVLFLQALGLFVIAIFIHPDHSFFKTLFFGAALLPAILFFRATFLHAKAQNKKSPWLAMMLVLPFIGNVFYLVHD